MREVVATLLRTAERMFTASRNATRAEMNELVELCLPPTERGITLEDMLGVFRAAAGALWVRLADLVHRGQLTDPAMILDVSARGARLIGDLSHGVTVRYLEGDRIWLQRTDAERALVHGVLGNPPMIEEATRAAQALGLRLFGEWKCAVYVATGMELGGTSEEARRALAERRKTTQVTGALSTLGAEVVHLLVGDATPIPAPAGWTLGVGRVRTGTQGARTSYDEASEAAEVALRRGLPRLRANDALLDRVFLGSLSAGELAAEVLAPIQLEPEGRRDMLYETLEAYLDAGGSITAASRELNLHAQSMRYRVEKLREVLDDDLDDPEVRLQLHLAVKSRRLLD